MNIFRQGKHLFWVWGGFVCLLNSNKLSAEFKVQYVGYKTLEISVLLLVRCMLFLSYLYCECFNRQICEYLEDTGKANSDIGTCLDSSVLIETIWKNQWSLSRISVSISSVISSSAL